MAWKDLKKELQERYIRIYSAYLLEKNYKGKDPEKSRAAVEQQIFTELNDSEKYPRVLDDLNQLDLSKLSDDFILKMRLTPISLHTAMDGYVANPVGTDDTFYVDQFHEIFAPVTDHQKYPKQKHSNDIVEGYLKQIAEVPMDVPEGMTEQDVSVVCLSVALEDENLKPVHEFLKTADDIRDAFVEQHGERVYMDGYLQNNFFKGGSTRSKDWALMVSAVENRKKTNELLSDLSKNGPAITEKLEKTYRMFASGASNTLAASEKVTMSSLALMSFHALNNPELQKYSTLTEEEKRTADSMQTIFVLENKLNETKKVLAQQRTALFLSGQEKAPLKDHPKAAEALVDYVTQDAIKSTVGYNMSTNYHSDLFKHPSENYHYMSTMGNHPEEFHEQMKQFVKSSPEYQKILDATTASNLIRLETRPTLGSPSRILTEGGENMKVIMKEQMEELTKHHEAVKKCKLPKKLSAPIDAAVKSTKEFYKEHQAQDLSKEPLLGQLLGHLDRVKEVSNQARGQVDTAIKSDQARQTAEGALTELRGVPQRLTEAIRKDMEFVKNMNQTIVEPVESYVRARDTLTENVEYQQFKMRALLNRHEQAKTEPKITDPDVREVVAGILVNRVLLGSVENSRFHMSADAANTFTDAKSIQRSIRDMAKSKSFDELMNTMTMDDVKSLASDQMGTEFPKEPVNRLFHKMLNGVRQTAPTQQDKQMQAQQRTNGLDNPAPVAKPLSAG